MSKVSTIEITGVGPIIQRTITLPERGGVVVLKGKCAQGKTTCLDSVGAVLGNEEDRKNVGRNDDVDEGKIVFHAPNGDRTLTLFATQKRTKGQEVNELGVEHVEDTYDIGKLIDPGMKNAEANDRERIRAIIQLSGAKIAWASFTALIPPPNGVGGNVVSIEGAREIEDTVAKASKVKSILEEEKRRLEGLAKKERQEQSYAEAALVGVDLSTPCDRAELQTAHQAAVAANARLKEQVTAAEKAATARAAARKQLDESRGQYQGPTVAAATVASTVAEHAKADADAEVQRLEQALRLAKASVQTKEAERKAAKGSLSAAQANDTSLATLTGLLEGQLPEPPSADDVEASQLELDAATDAMEAGVKVRDALAKQAKAEEHRDLAVKYESRAAQFEEAAKSTNDLLSKAVNVPGLSVMGLRLIHTDADGKEEVFDRLSTGEKSAVAVRVGSTRVSEKTGDGTKLLRLPQEVWQALDPDFRDQVNDIAISEDITVLTGEVSGGPLRQVTYGEPDTGLAA